MRLRNDETEKPHKFSTKGQFSLYIWFINVVWVFDYRRRYVQNKSKTEDIYENINKSRINM